MFTVRPSGTENSVVRSLLSIAQGRKIASVRTECPSLGTDNYIFPALFSVSQGRKITLSGVGGFTDVRTENSIESIRFSSARTYTNTDLVLYSLTTVRDFSFQSSVINSDILSVTHKTIHKITKRRTEVLVRH